MCVIGDGRAGGAIARALGAVGWRVSGPLGRGDTPADAADGVDLVVVATPDAAIAEVAGQLPVADGALIVHLAGALGPGALGAHPRRGVLHPLVSLPDPVTGADRLRDDAWFAVDADTADDLALLDAVVASLGGRAVHVPDDRRVAYHAAAVVASNHLVALFGQVERISADTGVPPEAYLGLARHTLDGLATRSAADALTGPVARGDWATVHRHLGALAGAERPAYAALAEAAAVLAGRTASVPAWLRDARCGDADGDDGVRGTGR